MANTCYDNFFLSNEIEDQYQSHLDLQQFCTVDNNLTGVAGMVRKIHKYKATDGTEKLTMGNGNTKTIEAGYTEKEYRIQMAQNRFQYYDEEAMTDPMVITTVTHGGDAFRRSGTILTNGHHGRLIQYDALSFYVNKGIRGTQVNGQVIGKHATKFF